MRRIERRVKALLLAFTLSTMTTFAQTQLQRQEISSKYDKAKLTQLKQDFRAKQESKKAQAINMASLRGWEILKANSDGSIDELVAVSNDGQPIYYTIYNEDAARSTRANHLNIGGSLGLSLDGQNMTAHVWDGGPTRVTHQEFDGPGGNNRVSINDGVTGLNGNSFHAQHVTGTIVASGVQAAAKGMAPRARALTHDWNNDLSEATAEAASGMLISNHSYGYRADLVPDWYFGAYIDETRDWDNLLYNSPYYLMVVAAGNDGNDNSSNGSPLAGASSFDKLTGHSTAKNNMVVANGQDANVNNDGSFNSVVINSSSSEGPTDDYRIKPDITGNGTGVYSTYDNSDVAYNSISGTSMASPNVAGTLLLLQQHYNNVNGSFMRAATLKGLALHTADDAGISGPDAVYGWGLLNAKKAAETISSNGGASIVSELTLSPGQTYTLNVDSDGSNPLIASISWTDPAGTANTGTTNLSTPVLVNDLDIRVSKGATTYTPYRLTGVNSNGTGDNTVDPYERVDISSATGSYTVTVTHKGSLSGGSQNFSLVVTGLGASQPCTATTPTGLSASNVGSSTASLSWSAVAGATYDVRYRQTGTTTWTTQASSGASASLSGLTPQTQYEAQVRSKCSDGSNSSYSSSVTFTTTEVQLNYCASNGNNTSDEYISRVQIGTIDNSTGASSGGYGDFTGQSTNLAKNASVTITVTPTWTGTTYNEAYSAWIDYNKDGDFTDAGEQVWTRSATQTTPVSGTFTVPSSAVEGTTRLRVSMKYNGIPTSCESFQYGEVEDYTVNITVGGDTQAPTAPTGLNASNVTQTTLTLNWNASTDNVGVTGYDVYQGASNIGSVTGTSANITGLAAGTSYTFTVRAKDAAGNVSAASNALNVTTQSAGMSCASTVTLPYAEGFETGAGWTQVTGDDGNWLRDANGTPSSNTGPSSAAQGSYYMYLEASTSGTGQIGSNATAILESPCFDLSGESAATFAFKYHMYGSNIGSLTVQASTDGNNWTNIWTQSGNQGNSWQTANIDLAAYLGDDVKLRMIGTTGNGWSSDIAIDDLSVSAGSTGGDTDVTLTIVLDNYPEETSWQIRDGSTVLASGGTYGSQPDGSTVTEVISLATGCYDFVINDSYGDGICCSYGSGSYSLTDGSTTLATGGSFGSSETTSFCVGGATSSIFAVQSSASVGSPVSVSMYPTYRVGEQLTIASNRSEVSYTITNLNGQAVESGQLVNGKVYVGNLNAGMYMIHLMDEGGKSIMKKFVKE
ncbi:MAG: S8 family serine peptidase [Ekhidna sp.]|uniref:S8 family serine peptidase n=1 Tax=Ekhidna sp. TaxID=2608089 RepID=UPI0032EAFA7B